MSIKWSSIKGEEYIKTVWGHSGDIGEMEDFINEALAEGFTPVRIEYGCKYVFVPCAPGEYICRSLLCLKKSGFFDSEKEAQVSEMLIADGAFVIPQLNALGSKTGVIAVRPSSLGQFEVTSDIDSKIEEYNARANFNASMGILWAAVGLCFIAAVDVIALGVVYFILSAVFFEQTLKYKKLVERLKAERESVESP